MLQEVIDMLLVIIFCSSVSGMVQLRWMLDLTMLSVALLEKAGMSPMRANRHLDDVAVNAKSIKKLPDG